MEKRHGRLPSKVEGSKDLHSSSVRSKRESKQVTERSTPRKTDGIQNDEVGGSSKRCWQNQDPESNEFPMQEIISKSEHGTDGKCSDPRTLDSSKPRRMSIAGSFFQHDDRSAIPDSRNVRRRPSTGHGSRSDSTKNHPSDRCRDRSECADARVKDNRDQVLGKDEVAYRTSHHDRFYELEANEPQERRKPPFRETKVVSRVVNPEGTTIVTNDKEVGYNKLTNSIKREGRVDASEWQLKVERGSEKDSHTGQKERDRDHAQRVETLQRGRWLERDHYNDRFQYRGRFSNSSRGREKMGRHFDGSGRNQLHSRTFAGEKWKHDLFDEANRSPSPKNEEEHIAKIEMLLAE